MPAKQVQLENLFRQFEAHCNPPENATEDSQGDTLVPSTPILDWSISSATLEDIFHVVADGTSLDYRHIKG